MADRRPVQLQTPVPDVEAVANRPDPIELGPIVLAPSSYWPAVGGVERVSDDLARGLLSRGVDASVATMRWPKTLPAEETHNGVRIYRRTYRSHTGSVRRRALAAADHPVALAALFRHYRRLRPQLVNIHCVSWAAHYHRRVAKWLGIPLVVSLHGELTGDATGLYQTDRRMRRFYRSVLAEATAVTACSEATLAEAEALVGAGLSQKSRVIHNGVDLNTFHPGSTPRPNEPYLFAYGRFVPEKGFDVLISALALVGNGAGAPRLVIAGDGPVGAELRKQAKDLALADRVDFVGRVTASAAAQWIRGALVAVAPSRKEAFGLTALEAMAAGAPLVVSQVGGVPEFVRDGVDALTVPAGDPAALASAIARLLEDKSLRRCLSASAVSRAQEYGVGRMVDAYLDLYEQTITAAHT